MGARSRIQAVFNVVTGRFDVRDAAERLPAEAMLAPSDMPEDEMDEIDPADEAAAEA